MVLRFFFAVMLIFLACTSVEQDNPFDQKGTNYHSVSDKGNDISNYRTVVIGTQTWMAENLNYTVEGSRCYGEGSYSFKVNDVQANCDKYGRLYDWAAAMALPSSCNTSSCLSQIGAKHRGVCPEGWHIPSQAEWDILSSYVQSAQGCSDCEANHLKATSGWNNYDEVSGNGNDTYGFAALPGGWGYPNNFNGVGYDGYWWSASEYDTDDAYYVYYLRLSNFSENAKWQYIRLYQTSIYHSVRCVKD